MSENKNSNWVLHNEFDSKFSPDPKGLGAFCYDKMKKFSNNIAQIDAETGKHDTYADILEKSIRVALGIESLGLKNDDPICLCTDNHRETVLPIWAAIFLGIPVGCLDPGLDTSDIKHLLNILKPKLIFTIPKTVKSIKIALQEINLEATLVIFGEETQTDMPFEYFLMKRTQEASFKPKTAQSLFDTAMILFTSGTTGLSKGISLTHYGLFHCAHTISKHFTTKGSLFYTSPYWISFIIITLSTLQAGGFRVVSRTLNEQKVMEIVEKYKITFLFLAPVYVYSMTSNPKYFDYNTSSLISMLVGGGVINKKQLELLNKLLPHTAIILCYGQTEICAFFSVYNTVVDPAHKLGSCGKMIGGCSCKIVDIETDQILGPNKPGELLVKTKAVMKGYYRNEEESKSLFDNEGFLHTGDILYYDEDGYFYYVDRIKDMFKYKSWHIVPSELENILKKHPGVKEVFVVGYPHEEDGDHPLAVIIREKGVVVSENDILQFFNSQVSDRKKLRAGVKFVDTFPKTVTGKYSRFRLRQMIINNEI